VAFIVNSYFISVGLLDEKSLLILATVGLSVAFIIFCLFNRTFPFSTGALFSIAGPSYLGFAMAHIVLLRRLDDGTQWLALTFLIVFGTDTAAFLGGRKFGKYRIAPRISPNKTLQVFLEGF
jgi:phosphatidate cytidylyltransferase